MAVLIIACPCALGLATPTAIAVGTGMTLRELVVGEGEDDATVLSRAAAVEASSEHPIAAAIVADARARNRELPDASDFASTAGEGVTAWTQRR